MNLISADRLGKSLGGRILFSELTLGLQDNEKVAIIGENGCGKSTLLRILAGKEVSDTGNLTKNKSCALAFLEQQSTPDPEHSIIEHILQSTNPRASALRDYEMCAEKAHEGDTAAIDKLVALSEKMEKLGAWDYERKLKAILQGFGIRHLDMKMGSLSGGMSKKVALAQILIEESNCLFLDEPTNHLDVDSIIWLQEYLSNFNGAIIMITHDRYFLDEICTGIYEIDQGELFFYKGNYSYYLEQKDARTSAKKQADKRIANILRTELEWLRRGPKARGTKAKARKDNAYRLMEHKEFKEADAIEIAVTGKRLGKKILEAENIRKLYGKNEIISSFSHTFKHGERVGIAGANGSGKTTLLRMLTGELEPDSGSIDKGMHTAFGFFTQQSPSTETGLRVIEYVEARGKTVALADGSFVTASKMLETFLFPPGQHMTPVEKLSGGERRRLFLLQVLMSNPNFLILDEPTNDLDVKTLSILEDFLQNFAGCIIVVSHDRYFMDRIADYLFVLDGTGNIKSFPGSFSDYLSFAKTTVSDTDNAEKNKTDSRIERKSQKEKVKLSFKETKEYESIESDIKQLEDEKVSIQKQLVSGTSDHNKYTEWGARLTELDKLITGKYERWEYLDLFSDK